MSEIVRDGIARFSSIICEYLFLSALPEFFIATSAVITPEAAEQTQSNKAKRLGKKLLVAAAKKNRSWVETNLKLNLFCSKIDLNPDNFDEVAYASTRMLHAWDIPAWIEGKPHLDASYTCLCPAMEMVDRGYQEIIAIGNQPGTLYRDIFGLEAIPKQYKGIEIKIIQPDIDPKDLGVDFTKATAEGLAYLYRQGQEKGRQFLRKEDNYS